MIAQAEKFGPDFNTFISFEADIVRIQAEALESKRERGEDLGPLFGVPIALKDLIATRDYPTTFGTTVLGEYTPDRNAVVVDQLLAADAIVFGKANAQELAFGSNGYNSHYGQQLNPYDPDRIAGGSSGGSAIAVSARMTPLSLGGDTAASIRVPAAFTGIYGHRPTTGRYDTTGIWPIAGTLDTVGPFARSVEDLALVDSVFTGDFTDLATVDPSEIRLGVPAGFFYKFASDEVKTAFAAYLKDLEAAGVTLVHVEMSGAEDLKNAGLYPILFYELIPAVTLYLETWGNGTTFDELYAGLGPDVKGAWDFLIMDGAPQQVPVEVYGAAISDARPRMRALYADYFSDNDLDAMIFPTAADDPPISGEGNPMEQVIDGETVSTFVNDETSYPGALAGVPGVSYPMAMSAGGFPIGVSLDGPVGRDRALLAIAATGIAKLIF